MEMTTMNKLDVLRSELEDKMEFFNWLVEDIESLQDQIAELELSEEMDVEEGEAV